MSKSSYVYVSYIRTTPEKVWDALTQPEFQKIYWGGTYQDTDWKPGSAWVVLTPPRPRGSCVGPGISFQSRGLHP